MRVAEYRAPSIRNQLTRVMYQMSCCNDYDVPSTKKGVYSWAKRSINGEILQSYQSYQCFVHAALGETPFLILASGPPEGTGLPGVRGVTLLVRFCKYYSLVVCQVRWSITVLVARG